MSEIWASISHEDVRELAKKRLDELATEAASTSAPSWVQNERNDKSVRCQFFDFAGFVKEEGFCSPDECRHMKERMAHLVQTEWNPSQQKIDSFGTGNKQNTARGDYFLESADRTHFFAEPEAMDDQQQLMAEYQNKKLEALNKVGHGLHIQQGVFQDYCRSNKIRSLVTDLGWTDPVVPQSMYIFKQARTGGAVNSHQDSTFLYTTPRQTCLGLWLALDDATLENGCLWVRLKSHREPVRRQYMRNVEHFGSESIKSRSQDAKGDTSLPKFIMETHVDEHKVVWEGSLPEGGTQGLIDAGFIPIECQAGDLLAFCGELDHLSLPNESDKPRHTFQLHLVEGDGVKWSASNWLQYPPGRPFLKLVD